MEVDVMISFPLSRFHVTIQDVPKLCEHQT